MKLATVEAFMPELRGNCYRTGRGRASNPKAAISRAIGDVLKQVRGKRWQTIKATISVVEITPNLEEKA
jgi:hypothetical protein